MTAMNESEKMLEKIYMSHTNHGENTIRANIANILLVIAKELVELRKLLQSGGNPRDT